MEYSRIVKKAKQGLNRWSVNLLEHLRVDGEIVCEKHHPCSRSGEIDGSNGAGQGQLHPPVTSMKKLQWHHIYKESSSKNNKTNSQATKILYILQTF